MSEIDLIRQLEKLKQVKPNKEWVSFTKESILSSREVVEERQGFNLWVRQLAPLTICVCLAITFGILYTANTQEQTLETAEVNDDKIIEEPVSMMASIVEVIETAQEQQEEPIEEIAYSDIMENIDSNSDTEAVLKEIERIRKEVVACEAQQEYLNEEQKQTCENMKKQLEIIDNFTKE